MDNAIQLISIFAAAMAVSFGAIGPALGEDCAVASAMDAIARSRTPPAPCRAPSLSD